MKWKGRLAFRQFIPSKRHRFGIKFFVLCDVLTGYVEDMIIYTGSSTDIQHYPGLGISGSVVMTLLAPYLSKCHVLYVDNWYSSPILFQHLLSLGTGACGTVRGHRKGMPKFTTVHPTGMAATGKLDHLTGQPMMKPACVLMRGLLEEYSTLRGPTKGGRPALDTPLRLTARHFPSEVPQTTSQGSKTRRHCKVCLSSTRKGKQRRLTKHMCVPCNTPLCAVPCFEEYHTLKHN